MRKFEMKIAGTGINQLEITRLDLSKVERFVQELIGKKLGSEVVCLIA